MSPMRKTKTLFYRLHQQHHRCFYCGHCLAAEDADITLDHVAPQHLGWIAARSFDNPLNAVAACHECNRDKGGRMPTAEETARLEAMNVDYSDSAADAHYRAMLRISAHSLKLLELYRVH